MSGFEQFSSVLGDANKNELYQFMELENQLLSSSSYLMFWSLLEKNQHLLLTPYDAYCEGPLQLSPLEFAVGMLNSSRSTAINFFPETCEWSFDQDVVVPSVNFPPSKVEPGSFQMRQVKNELARQYVLHKIMEWDFSVWSGYRLGDTLPDIVQEMIIRDDVCLLLKVLKQKGAPSLEDCLESNMNKNTVWHHICRDFSNYTLSSFKRYGNGCGEILGYALSQSLTPQTSKSNPKHPYARASYSAAMLLNSFNELSDCPELIKTLLSTISSSSYQPGRDKRILDDLNSHLEGSVSPLYTEAKIFVSSHIKKSNHTDLNWVDTYACFGEVLLKDESPECVGEWSVPALSLNNWFKEYIRFGEFKFYDFKSHADTDKTFESNKDIGGYGFGMFPLLLSSNPQMNFEQCLKAVKGDHSFQEELANYFGYLKGVSKSSSRFKNYMGRASHVYKNLPDMEMKEVFLQELKAEILTWEKGISQKDRDESFAPGSLNPFDLYLKELSFEKEPSFRDEPLVMFSMVMGAGFHVDILKKLYGEHVELIEGKLKYYEDVMEDYKLDFKGHKVIPPVIKKYSGYDSYWVKMETEQSILLGLKDNQKLSDSGMKPNRF